MKFRKAIRYYVLKVFWSFERPYEYLVNEGSFIINPKIEENRVKVLLKLFYEQKLVPTFERAKLVDFCVYETRNLVKPIEYAYKLYLALQDKFTSNLKYNKELARNEILKFQATYKGENSFYVYPKKKVIKTIDGIHKAKRNIKRYKKMPLTFEEGFEATQVQMAYYDLLYEGCERM